MRSSLIPGLTRNVASEVRRAQVACAAGLDTDRLRVKLQPPWTTKIPDGLNAEETERFLRENGAEMFGP